MSARLHVESSGRGPPLVLLHGWAMHSGVWGDLATRLGRHRRVHAVDLPGHGFSAPTSPFTIAGVVRALEGAFAGERSPIEVVGWSLGGHIALAWALAHPERIARLVLVATTPRFVAGDGWDAAMSRETLKRFGDELDVAWKATVLRFLTLQMRAGEHGPPVTRSALAALRGELFARGEPSRRTLAESFAVLSTSDLRAEASRIAHPALVIAGNRDMLVPAAAGEWLASTLRNGNFVSIDGAAHVPFLSHPAEFGQALRGFLDTGATVGARRAQ